MPTLFVARSANICQWASDVGLGKNIFKVGLCDGDPAPLVAAGWAGETDWKLLRQQDDVSLDETMMLERLVKRQKQVDPTYYPRVKGEMALFKVTDAEVQRHIMLGRAMAQENEKAPIRLKAADYAAYLIAIATR